MVVKINDIWSVIHPTDKTPWLKLPCWAISFFTKNGIYGNNLLVLIYIFSCIYDDISLVKAPADVGMRYCGVNEKAYSRAVKYLKNFGLIKIGNGKYDLTQLANLFASFKSKEKVNIEEDVLENKRIANIGDSV